MTAQANAPATGPDSPGPATGAGTSPSTRTTPASPDGLPCVDGWDDLATFAARAGVTPGTAWKWVRAGRVPGAVKAPVQVRLEVAYFQRKTQTRHHWRVPPGATVLPGPGRRPPAAPPRPAGTLTAHEVAAATGWTVDRVQGNAHQGRIPHGRDVGGRYTFAPDVVDTILAGDVPPDPRAKQQAHIDAIEARHRRILAARWHARGCVQDGGTLRHRVTPGFTCPKCAKDRSTMDKNGNREWTHLK